MKHEQPPYPRRPSPELLAHIGDAAVILTYDNTTLHSYSPWQRQFVHFRVSDPELMERPIFDQPHILRNLFRLDFPIKWQPNVEDWVVDEYIAWQADRLGAELDEL